MSGVACRLLENFFFVLISTTIEWQFFVFYKPESTRRKWKSKMCLHSERREKKNERESKCLKADLIGFYWLAGKQQQIMRPLAP